MFSFRTTSIFAQEDLALTKGRVGVLCDHTAWDPQTGEYIWESFQKRGVLKRTFLYDVEKNALNEPLTAENLKDLSALVIELQDLGCRYSPYPALILNLFNTVIDNGLEISVFIVDRVNPGGRQVEGTLLRAGYRSEIGIEGIPHRHALTLGELAHYFYNWIGAKFPFHIISYKASTINKLLMPWSIPPTPYYSGLFTSAFYCGQYLWRATNVSEGKGTSRPYEMFGAPFIEELSTYCKEHGLDGWNSPKNPLYTESVKLRWCNFTPKFDKWAGLKCYGFQILLNPDAGYNSVLHALKLMRFINDNCPAFRYSLQTIGDENPIDEDKKTIELLLGDKELIDFVKGFGEWADIKEHIKLEEQKWIKKARRFLLYPGEDLFRIK